MKHMLEYQEKLIQEQMKKNEELAKKVNRTTLNVSPEAVTVKL